MWLVLLVVGALNVLTGLAMPTGVAKELHNLFTERRAYQIQGTHTIKQGA
jgi:hypothetical protein